MTALRGTYRLQLGTDLDFAAARELVPYLKDLGVSHLYLSPSFQARPGSTHGYDVTDPGRISEELGGEDEFRALAEAGLGLILDIVPNHMAAADENRYWADAELRPKFFDIDHETGRWRRFFDIDHLAAVRQEDPEVFAETHRLALRLVREGLVDGLRIDHPDGLADPAGYLRRLCAEGVDRVWVEKILDPGESLRDWPVEGTVGYEFLNDAAALFVDPGGGGDLNRAPPGPLRPAGGGRRSRGAGGQPSFLAAARNGGAQGVRHALPADDARDHGEGRRGHRLLPLQPPPCVERGRRRSDPLRHLRGAVSCGLARASPSLPPRAPDHPDARHEAERRRARPDRGTGRHGR